MNISAVPEGIARGLTELCISGVTLSKNAHHVTQLREKEQRLSKFGRDRGYAELLLRMARLVELLEPHQRNYHLCVRINIYWYIEKHKEIELLLSRVSHHSNGHLRHYLDTLCGTIRQKIEDDEKFADEFLSVNR